MATLKLAMLSVHSSPTGHIGARDTGGMSIYVREVARHLGRQGVLVDIFTRVHDPDHGPVVALGDNVRLVHIRVGADNISKLAVYPHLPTFARNLDRFRCRHGLRYDLLFSHYWLSGWVGNVLHRRWQVPHLVMFHTIGAIKNAIGIGEREPALRIETERALAGNGHHIIAATGTEKAELVRHYGARPEKITVIPCGVNLDLFQPVDRASAKRQLGFPDSPVVLFVGRIEPLKGVDQLVRAVACLRDGPRPRLVIIGGDDHSRNEVARLQRLSAELGIADSVSFLGTIAHEALPRYYCAADVCAVASYYESFGLVALESLACGTPVVATDVGNLRNIIRQGETGYVLPDSDPRPMADRISRLLAAPGGNDRAAAIRASVAGYDWSRVAQAVMAKCQQVLAS